VIVDPKVDTRGYLRTDPQWHVLLDDVESVDGVVRHTRDYLATLTPAQLRLLPEPCRHLRVKAEDDVEYWTCKLSSCFPSARPEQGQLVQDLFMHFLHASMRICQIHRDHAARLDTSQQSDGL
jgi:hypothetical protein